MSTAASIALSAAFAGLVAIAVTMAIERWGGVLGGFLGTLPTTIVPAAIGIANTSVDVDQLRAALLIAPAGMFLDAGFLYLWRVVPPRLPSWSLGARLVAMSCVALLAWGLGAIAMVTFVDRLRSSGFPLVIFAIVTTATLATVGLLACLRPLPAPRGTRRVGPITLIARGGLAAVAIAVAVFLASVGGALVAGVAAVFPAIFLTTMVSLWLAQGEAVTTGAVGPMMLGSTSVAVYAVVAAFTMPAWGLALGSVGAWVIAVGGVTVPVSLLFNRFARPA